ncbi:cytochrome c [Rhodovulum sulfidophilum]|uniref:c-type cytochrome n=1 Tax=Rhodovulum sulfidophilum TaxID=35806 RepID=UPI0019225C84|nr:cytochrome c [Rhodovulum sulfidophilum]MBL3575358.1 cytochrome c [Rhodovulum sulfidophilum]MCE8431558.1 cytochrome c [Rhodovulum sulfidophilum]MCF4116243.1 cytochrome c [Rhodovulum sulfidophilum]
MKRPFLIGVAGGAAVAAGLGGWLWLRSPGADVGSRALVQVEMPRLSPQAEAGQAVFSDNCAQCHGTRADGREGLGPPLIHPIYEPDHHGDYAFLRAARQGVRAHHWRFGDMAPVPGVSTADIASVVRFVREVQRANGIR